MVSTVTARLLIACAYLAVSPSMLIISTDATVTPVTANTTPVKPLPENLQDMVLSAGKNRFGLTIVSKTEMTTMMKSIIEILKTLAKDMGNANLSCKSILKLIAKVIPASARDVVAKDMSRSVERQLKGLQPDTKKKILQIYGTNTPSTWADKLVTALLSDATFIIAVLPATVLRLFGQAKLPVPESTLTRIKNMADIIKLNGSNDAYTTFCTGVEYITAPTYRQMASKAVKVAALKAASYVKSGTEQTVVLESDIPLFAELKREFGEIVIPEAFANIEAFIQTLNILHDELPPKDLEQVSEEKELTDICQIEFSAAVRKGKLQFAEKIVQFLQSGSKVTAEIILGKGADKGMELAASVIGADVLAYAETIRMEDVETFIDRMGQMDNWEMIKLTCTAVTTIVAKFSYLNPVGSAQLVGHVGFFLAAQAKSVATNMIGNQIIASGNGLAERVEKWGQNENTLPSDGTSKPTVCVKSGDEISP